MAARRSIEQWARDTEFDSLLPWGEIEDEILKRRLPPLPGESAGWRLLEGVLGLIFAVWVGLLAGASLIALVLILVAQESSDASLANQLVDLSEIPLVVSLAGSVVIFFQSHGGRWRPAWEIVVPVLHGIFAGLCWALISFGSIVSGSSSSPWFALAASVVSFLVALVLAVQEARSRASRRGEPSTDRPRASKRPKVPSSFERRQRCLAARESVMEVLDERGLVELQEFRKKKMLSMPLGAWSTL